MDTAVPVLIVDDFTTMRRIIRTQLEQIGFANLDEAGNGAAALEKLQARKFGLVIADWTMDPMSGLELLKRIRSSAELGAIPFIMLLSDNRSENIIAAKVAGGSTHIVKPFDAQTLKNKISSVL